MSRVSEAKKLVSVLVTSASTTNAREKALERVSYICYLVQFKKDKTPLQPLINLGSEINAMYLSFAKQLGLLIRLTDVRAQKIDGTTLETHEIVVAVFSVVDKVNRERFFEESFLVDNVSPDIVLGMLFLTLSNADVDFLRRDLWWRVYTIEKTISTTRCVKLVGK